MKLKKNKKSSVRKQKACPSDVKVIRTNVDPDILMIRTLLALPMHKRTNFLRVRLPDQKGSAL